MDVRDGLVTYLDSEPLVAHRLLHHRKAQQLHSHDERGTDSHRDRVAEAPFWAQVQDKQERYGHISGTPSLLAIGTLRLRLP